MELVFPSFKMINEAIDYVQEHFEYGEKEIHGDGGLDRFANNYEQWIAKINTDLTRNDAGYVSATTYFAVADNRIIGTIQIRHRLNDTLLLYNGHIGYGVRPSERRKGYATQMLALAVEKCRELNIDKALVTCYK